MELSRRQFMKVTGSTLAGSSLALMGFSPATALAEVRQYKLAAHHGHAQHLPLLLGRLRHPHVLAGRRRQERQAVASSTSKAIPTTR